MMSTLGKNFLMLKSAQNMLGVFFYLESMYKNSLRLNVGNIYR